MKSRTIFFLVILLNSITAQFLKVSDDNHHLVYDNGKPFIWIGDTAWELIHRCSREEVELYFKDRSQKGFNVIQTVILSEIDGINIPNEYGEKPLVANNPLKPNEKYFEYVDWVIKNAAEYNLYLALLPTWGDKWHDKNKIIFTAEEKAKAYCYWLGNRYKNNWNIVWILGGDRIPETPEQIAIIRAMAKGLQMGDGKKHVISFHPYGGKSSSEWFRNEEWLSFNMAQTGHWRRHEKVYKMISSDYKLTPAKPNINGEPQYEDIPVRFDINNERFTAYDVREAAYWSILSGAFGHTYGNGNIWQMWKPGRKSILGARIPWDIAIRQAGSKQMGYVRQVFESRPFLKMIPDQQILSDYFGQDYDVIRAARDKNSSYFIVYIPQGQTTRLRMQKLKADTVSGYWFNPREGTSIKIKPFVNPKTDMDFVPISKGERTDWVLILDELNKDYPDPAKIEYLNYE